MRSSVASSSACSLPLASLTELAHGGRLLLGHRAHLLHEGGELAVRADVAGLGGFKFGAGLQGGQFGRGLGQDRGDGFLHEGGEEKGRSRRDRPSVKWSFDRKASPERLA